MAFSALFIQHLPDWRSGGSGVFPHARFSSADFTMSKGIEQNHLVNKISMF
jgi:hypothetical protein